MVLICRDMLNHPNPRNPKWLYMAGFTKPLQADCPTKAPDFGPPRRLLPLASRLCHTVEIWIKLDTQDLKLETLVLVQWLVCHVFIYMSGPAPHWHMVKPIFHVKLPSLMQPRKPNWCQSFFPIFDYFLYFFTLCVNVPKFQCSEVFIFLCFFVTYGLDTF